MAKRGREPDEAIGPELDGTVELDRLARRLRELPDEEVERVDDLLPEPEKPQVVLICGACPDALAVARLAADCGFVIELAVCEAPPGSDELAGLAQVTHVLDNYDDFVTACDVDRNHYVCVFDADAGECVHILSQCMPSSAAYLGLAGDAALRDEIFAALRAQGAPDAELCAICCPMGLSIGAEGPTQRAIAIVAELLAARSGVLKRLRFG